MSHFKEEIFKELDHLSGKWKREIRALNEVVTDDKGREIIGNSIASMWELYDFFKRYTAYLEMNNVELGLRVEHDGRMKWECGMLKRSLEANIKLDEIGAELKEKIIKLKSKDI